MRSWVRKIIVVGVCLLGLAPFAWAQPQPVQESSAVTEKIANEVNRLIRETPRMSAGIVVASLETGQILYEHNADKSFVPASNLKLFTAEAALSYSKLGPDFKFHTTIERDANNVYFVFDGDPSLTSKDILSMVRTLKKDHGVHEVNNLYIDNSRYTQNNWGAGWMVHGDYACYNAPSNAIVVNRNCGADGAVRNLEKYAEGLLSRDFHREGIRIKGHVLDGKAPSTAEVLVTHASDPLAEVMKHMLKVSDNVYANSIFKKLGQEYYLAPGSWENGGMAEKSILDKSVGLNPQHLSIHDGSGLSRYTLVSPSQIVKLLSFAHSQDTFRYFYNDLPISGVDGTLMGRMTGRGVRGRVHAKTGSMSGVSSLSGYLLTRNNHLLAFSIIVNDFKGPLTPYRAFEDRLVTFLTQLDVR